MPAKKVTKRPQATDSRSSAGQGVSASLTTSSRGVPQHQVKGRMCSPVGTYLAPCEARIHRQLMAAMGATFGALVELIPQGGGASSNPAVLRVLPPTEACRTMNAGSDIAVSLDTLDALGTDQVVISNLTVPVSILAHISLAVSQPPEGSSVSPTSSTIPPSSLILLEAVFRRQFRLCVVHTGMKAIVRIGTHPVEVTVSSLVLGLSEGAYPTAGYLSDATTVVIEAEGSASPSEPPHQEMPLPHGFPSHHTLYHGPSGAGKTHVLQELETMASTKMSPPWSVYRFSALREVGSVSAFVTTVDRLWSSIQRHSSTSSRLLIIIDNLDTLVSSGGSSDGPSASLRFCASLAQLMGQFQPSAQGGPPRVLFVASATSLGSFPTQLLSPQLFGGRCVPVLPPASAADRMRVLEALFREYFPSGEASATADGELKLQEWQSILDDVSKHSHGFNQRDLAKVRSAAVAVAFDTRGTVTVQPSDVPPAARAVRPSALSTVEVAIPNVKWSDIGGSDEAKAVLKEYVEWCLGEQRWVFESLRLSPPKGVLLYGPPGCSKTMLAKALANESKMNFVSVKGPEVFSKWVGDSEKAVRRVFSQARAAAPCVVFIDELDGMCGHRGSGGVGDRVISQLLTELDGLPAAVSSKTDNIILVAATNRPENIDGAVLRPGRIDRRVYVGLPNIGERQAIAELSLKRVPRIVEEVSPEKIAALTEGYTGAEVVAVCKEASFQALTRCMEAEAVTGGDLAKALEKVRPRVSKEDVDWYLKWGKQSTI